MVVTVDYFYPIIEPDVKCYKWKTLYLPLFFLGGIVCMVERKILGKEKKITT